MPAQQLSTRPWPLKVLERLLVPFRSNPFSQTSLSRCGLGLATCRSSGQPTPSRIEFAATSTDDRHPAMLELRADHAGPIAHHWLELESPGQAITFGFGPATLPFIDSGQVSLEDRYGNTEWVSGMHPLPWLALPPIKYDYARAPGEGRIIGKSIPLTIAQSDALTRKLLHLRFVGPYIPVFHDCRTFVCATQASVQNRSSLPCYLLFKGYW